MTYLEITPRRVLNEASRVWSTPLTSLPATISCAPCSSGSVDRSFADGRLGLPDDLLAFGLVNGGELLVDQLRDGRVLVVVLEEVARDEERREVVVGVGVVREPAELVDRVGIAVRALE